jgi:hypothetical protein
MVIVALFVTASACRPPSLYMIEPSGPPEYKLGWEDGCEDGTPVGCDDGWDEGVDDG